MSGLRIEMLAENSYSQAFQALRARLEESIESLTNLAYGHNMLDMAIPKIKATYSLDVETIRALERTSRRWRVSKSEVLRRAIHAVDKGGYPAFEDDALVALNELQQSLGLSDDAASRWQESAGNERYAYSERRLSEKA